MMALTTININGEEYVNVDELIQDFVEDRGRDCGEYTYDSITDSDDEGVDTMISYLLDRNKRELAERLKSAWIKKRYGSFFRE